MRQPIIRFTLLAAFVALAFVAALQPRPAATQSQPPLVVGIVDWDSIMRDSKAAKSIRQQLDAQKASYQTELNKQKKALDDADQKLASQRSTLSDADFRQKVQDLKQQAELLQKSFKQRQEQLDATLRKGLDQIRVAALQIVTDMAKQRKLTLVLTKAEVVLADSDYDLTNEAMQKLDAQLPSVKLPR
jgi:outer membrane protein